MQVVTNTPRVVLLVTGSLLFPLISCGDPLPIQYETEHLRIGSELQHPMCAGDLQHYETLIAKTESDLAMTLNHTIDVFIWSDVEWEERANRYCGGTDHRACYIHHSGTIFAGEFALSHEIVHAVVGEPNLPSLFGEGIAEMYAGRQTRFAISTPSSYEGSMGKISDLTTATHFAHWLRHRWGGARLGELARLGSAAFSEFERVYGIPFDVAEQMYLEEAPAAFPALYACDASRMDFAPSTVTWSTQVELDCENSTATRANYQGLFTSRTFTIESDGPYYLYADRGWMQASLCIEYPVESLPNEEEELIEEDIPFMHTGYPSETVRYFSGGKISTNDAGQKAHGGSIGWQVNLGLMLRLDFIERGAAYDLDRLTGINHTYLFGEWQFSHLDGFGSDKAMPVGDDTFTVGLAVAF